MVTCQNCGNEVEEGVKLCKNCGSEIIQDETTVEEQIKHCSNCGFEIKGNVKFCPSCGFSTSEEVQNVNSSSGVCNPNKSAGLAALLSFLIIGLGQVYIGLTKKGILLFVAAIVSGVLMLFLIGWILWLLVWGYAIYDAYNSANKMNEGIAVEDTIDFNNLF